LELRNALGGLEHPLIRNEEPQPASHRQRKIDAVVDRMREREREIGGLLELV
jgi:hypothetical protein